MDPLSISAGIVAVLKATTAVFLICYTYRAAINDAPWESCQTIEEIKGLRSVLETLQDLAVEAKTADSVAHARLPSLVRLSEPDGPLARCLAELRPTTCTSEVERARGAETVSVCTNTEMAVKRRGHPYVRHAEAELE